ncbi:MAG TPA: cyclase family protein [Pyrinomonadaceae bacterium]|nr:cyclase family protein [Pyrinomonadaceae bacterium]
MMKIYDVSVALSAATPTYPGDPGIRIEEWKTFAKGDNANVSFMHFGVHSGTHVDAPAHFIEGGATVDALPLDSLIGEVEVVEVGNDRRVIDADFVATHCRRESQRLLFKTRNSAFWNHPEDGFREDYTYLDPAAAKILVDWGVKLVGIDYLSVEQFESKEFATHRHLLSRGVVILEGLDLRAVPAGQYELICLPLKFEGSTGDGAPARVVLRTLIDSDAR